MQIEHYKPTPERVQLTEKQKRQIDEILIKYTERKISVAEMCEKVALIQNTADFQNH